MPYQVPVMTAVTTALAQGGMGFGGASPAAPGAVPFDIPVNRVPISVLAGSSLTIILTAIPAGKTGLVTAIGVTTDDVVNTRITTRINGVSVPPLQAVIGAVGTMEAPTSLASPIALNPGDVFSLLLENLDVAPHNLAGRILGWRTA